ncbi:hypothetical protein FB45DRAFT_927415 [Roridomyces roridus]|uniref:Uncharacterized protein n=1 Tax=Roridomyces roridus TaxID=1738132 RepID=A0AAD7BJ69_9AGAR|nr:hypothetical protein FB45DRAFT_927415 [Roridomyces roridus]
MSNYGEDMLLTLRPLNLSLQVQSTSAAVDRLHQALGTQRIPHHTAQCLQTLQKEIEALRQVLGLSGLHQAPTSPINQLAEHAVLTLWDEIPLQSLAQAHKERAQELMHDGQNDHQVYIECVKYLHLHPTKDGPDFTQMKRRVRTLEHHLAGRPQGGY